ncbi:MAG: MASE1 domain-containing protein, partial [Planctomycetota bacterium]|nr:MASE1 domain-containing protein [Planctomycetota bacterium]
MPQTPSGKTSSLLPQLLLLVGYVALGVGAIQLAIPPNVAAPVWPAAGLTVLLVLRWGYRLWPAVVLGSVFTNLIDLMIQGGSPDWSAQQILIPMIALGTVLRSHLGAFVVRRWAWSDKRHMRSDLLAMLLAGPLASVFSATIGCMALAAVGSLGSDGVLGSWLLWWLADCIGVVVMWPILVPLVWPERRSPARSWLLATVPLVATVVLVLVAFLAMREQQNRAQLSELRDTAQRMARSLQTGLRLQQEALRATVSFVSTNENVNAHDFKRFTRPLLQA